MPTRRAALAASAALAALAVTTLAQAEDWPHKPVRIVVPFGAGGNTDIIARLVAQRLGESLGQQFVVENRPGASGAIAAASVARSPPDGYTLLMAALPQIAIVPAMTKTPYDPVRDFVPISNIGTNPLVLAVHPSIPADNFAALVDYARGRPSGLTFASSGPGTVASLATIMLSRRAGLKLIEVSYKGGGAAPLADVIGATSTCTSPTSPT